MNRDLSTARRQRPGIRDVARTAGVSITTVSHALSGKRPVSESTRLRVLDAVELLGYRPDPTAGALRAGRRGMIAITVTPIQGNGFHFTALEFYRHFIDAATWTALGRDYSVVVVPPADGAIWGRLAAQGAIVVDPRIDDVSLKMLRRHRVPFVTMGRDPAGEETEYWVDNNNAQSTRLLLDHLAGQGAQRIALLCSPPTTSYSIDVLATYRSWCSSRNRDVIVEIVENLTEQSGASAARGLIQSRHPPDAIHGTVDCLGVGALSAAEQLGVLVPRDLLIATCGESELQHRSQAFLTRLSDNPQLAGSAATNMVIDLLERGETEPRHRTVPCLLHLRPSTLRSPAGTEAIETFTVTTTP